MKPRTVTAPEILVLCLEIAGLEWLLGQADLACCVSLPGSHSLPCLISPLPLRNKSENMNRSIIFYTDRNWILKIPSVRFFLAFLKLIILCHVLPLGCVCWVFYWTPCHFVYASPQAQRLAHGDIWWWNDSICHSNSFHELEAQYLSNIGFNWPYWTNFENSLKTFKARNHRFIIGVIKIITGTFRVLGGLSLK